MTKFKGYKPKSGIYAGAENRKKVAACMDKDPLITGAEISRVLGLSLPTVYNHMKHIRYGVEKA